MTIKKRIEILERQIRPLPPQIGRKLRDRFVGILSNFPEHLIVVDHLYGSDPRLHPDEIEDIKNQCREVAERLRLGKIKTIRELFSTLPVECFDALCSHVTKVSNQNKPQTSTFPALPIRRRLID